MIEDIPSAQDYYSEGKELLDFAWDSIARLITQLDEAEGFGVEKDEVSQDYWTAAKRILTTALAVTQQGVEFILKGRIADISPFLLIADPPSKWPSPYGKNPVKFSEFRSIDAQDLIKTLDTISNKPLDSNFVAAFHDLRKKRNKISHTVSKSLSIHVSEVVDSLLNMHKSLFPNETWAAERLRFISSAPEIHLGSIDYVRNRTCWEISLIYGLLKPAQIKKYFGVNKKSRLYICPTCHFDMDRSFDDNLYRLAALTPNSPTSTSLYCPVCNDTYQIARSKCDQVSFGTKCKGNVISVEEALCLVCGEEVADETN